MAGRTPPNKIGPKEQAMRELREQRANKVTTRAKQKGKRPLVVVKRSTRGG